MTAERRTSDRVKFGHGHSVRIVALDGSWSRQCVMQDVSDVGAKLVVEGSLEGLELKEFFLALTTVGQAHRRCAVAWVAADQIGVKFLKPAPERAARPDADSMAG